MELIQDPRAGASLLSVVAPQQTLPPGAAVFDLDGQFVGLATRSGALITLVPGESVRALAQQAHEAPARPGDLGIDVQALTAVLARASGAESGVMISYVDPRGPAAGELASGDVIRSIDGINVTTTGGFQQLVSTRQPGKEVVIAGVRQGKGIEVTVRAVEAGLRSASVPSDTDPGVVLRAVPNVGLEVVALEPGAAAARAGLQPGDIVVAVDGRATTERDVLTRAFRTAASGAALLLTVRRGTGHRVVALEKP
jgi:serine protease Do